MRIKRQSANKYISPDPPSIIYEDDRLLVLYKPSGWIVNSSQTSAGQAVIQDWLSQNYDFEVFSNREHRNGIVHRLDKETSGCLIIAKDSESFLNLQEQFRTRVIKKRYTALAHGLFSEQSGAIDQPVGRLPWRRDRFGVLEGGRQAYTSYKVEKVYSKDLQKFSLVTLAPRTGRTHQIRIHLKFMGNPIVSDLFYAGRKTARHDRLWCPRLFLHAANITFKSPEDSRTISVDCQLPVELEESLSQLQVE